MPTLQIIQARSISWTNFIQEIEPLGECQPGTRSFLHHHISPFYVNNPNQLIPNIRRKKPHQGTKPPIIHLPYNTALLLLLSSSSFPSSQGLHWKVQPPLTRQTYSSVVRLEKPCHLLLQLMHTWALQHEKQSKKSCLYCGKHIFQLTSRCALDGHGFIFTPGLVWANKSKQ